MDFDVNLSTFTYENCITDYDDFPITEEPVYILGEEYSALYDRDKLTDDIRSRLWITYRRNFPNIGGVGPSSDQGWGCMLRCGQMMLAQALLLRHLGRGWRWKPDRSCDTYWRLLKMFEDKKTAIYSIHQIASMGESEGKTIGQWFGPNTIAQVLKRISTFDEWSNMVIHIALDNVVIQDDIWKKCRKPTDLANGETAGLPDGEAFSPFVNDAAQTESQSRVEEQSRGSSKQGRDDPQNSTQGTGSSSGSWKPLLLIIPLRLGLTDINPIYFDSLKTCLALPQSVGIIGGKPNHAHWFVGYVGQELIYLDPHTSQVVVDLDNRGSSDTSYHCATPPSRMGFHKLDPSIALGFYCGAEKDFDDLCDRFTTAYDKSCRTMFEVRKAAPKGWPTEDSTGSYATAVTNRTRINSLSDCNFSADGATTYLNSSMDDDEEFELI